MNKEFRESCLIQMELFFKLGIEPIWFVEGIVVTQEEYDAYKEEYYRE